MVWCVPCGAVRCVVCRIRCVTLDPALFAGASAAAPVAVKAVAPTAGVAAVPGAGAAASASAGGDAKRTAEMEAQIQRLTAALHDAKSAAQAKAQAYVPAVAAADVVVGAEIGRGAYKCVYRATWHGAAVAKLKLIASERDVKAAAAFEGELKALSALRHPNIGTHQNTHQNTTKTPSQRATETPKHHNTCSLLCGVQRV